MGKLLIGVAAIVPSGILNAFALSVCWEWFVRPVFGTPGLSIPMAWGLIVVAGFLQIYPLDKDDDDWLLRLIMSFVKPLVLLSVGWLIHLFV